MSTHLMPYIAESRRPEELVGGGLGRDEESGVRMVGRRRRRVPWKEVETRIENGGGVRGNGSEAV